MSKQKINKNKIKALKKMFFKEAGFTLTELLVAIGMGIIVIGAIFSFYLYNQQSFTSASAYVEINTAARLAMDWMSRDLRWAQQLITNKTINSQYYITGTEEIILKIPSIDSSGDIIDGVFDYVVYHLSQSDSTKLERIIDANALSSRVDETRIIANNISSLTFSSAGTELSNIPDVTTLTNVAIELTTSKVASRRTLSQTVSSTIKLRNKV
jgi:Tfp pilus assembly protein PilW